MAKEDIRLNLHERLGKNPNEFTNTNILALIEFEQPQTEVFVPNRTLDSIEDSTDFSSPNYGSLDTGFADDFEYWLKDSLDYSEYTGYIAGFPRIINPDKDAYVDCLHLWSYNSSVFDETFAVPFTAIRSLYIYSNLRTKLVIEAEELGYGGSSNYEIPVMRSVRTGELFYRQLDETDIENLLEKTKDEAPVLAIDGLRSTVKSFRFVTPDNLKTILNN